MYWGLAAAALLYLLMASALGLPLLAHSAHDSYTLQAMLWRDGHVSLAEDLDWLELARYGGRYYISFPPFPSVPMWVFSLFFGGQTPSMLVVFLLFLGSYLAGYGIARRCGLGDMPGAAYALFWVAGCNLLEVSLYGGVWNMAQGMGFFLMMLTVYGWLSPGAAWAYAAPVCLAFAVGCRPFYAVYVPVALCLLWWRQTGGPWQRFARALPKLALPAAVACAYAAYNWVRFGNALEFGHNYLPEFVEAEHGQFSLAYVAGNVANILRLPTWQNHQLRFPTAFGFAFYIANPLYALALGRGLAAVFRREKTARPRVDAALDWLLPTLAAIHFCLYLLHKSFGAWQFGTRYLVDVLPVLGWWTLRRGSRFRTWEGLIMLWAVAFNIYGGLLFHLG
jgi:hypothetical protein